ncbi:MAG TPA: gamma-glutamylcyclotransferase family protein [Rhizomicrobium sp.]
MNQERLFSYGTLRDEKVQCAVFGRPVAGTPDAITGYRLRSVTISSKGAAAISGTDAHTILEPGEGDPIEGTLFHISAADLACADAYESAEYKRIRVRLRSGVDAWVYVRA